ncbi:hypothetical protein F8G81_05350 [Arthrobacter sp. CDRTa11]|uniref:hypothetical protein n=1 Tax=Arthrobacter sp. CDRTa11 TaxID=2651199 RepID=UPI002265F913|nr:hypothetical protein [Arthrobacter sp. CDRTa11]UZX02108.1 hypothetical protein F8G81_05350 [Arthrobacter sp. CDRTa11]
MGRTTATALLLALTILGTGCAGPDATVENWQGRTIDLSDVSVDQGLALVSAVPIDTTGQVTDPAGRSQIVVLKSITTQHPDVRGLIVSSSKAASSGSLQNFAADWQLPPSGVVGHNAESLAQAVEATEDAVTTVLIDDGKVIGSWSKRVVLTQEIDAALTEAAVPTGSTPTTAP